MPWLHRTSTNRKNCKSYSTIAVMRDSSQFRNTEWIFLFLQPLHSASYAWVLPPVPLWGPHTHTATPWQTQVNPCLNTGISETSSLPSLARELANKEHVLVNGNAFNPRVTALFTSTTPEESGKANKSSKLVDRWDI